VRDLLYVIATVAFFALTVALVKGCDLLIGPDELADDDEPELELDEAA
jgi:hypothetical protein